MDRTPHRRARLASIALFSTLTLVVAGCAGPAPFSQRSPGLDALAEEMPHLYAQTDTAMAALAQTDRPTLSSRVHNLIATYESELRRAEAAQGGMLNTVLSVIAVVVPLSGTVGSLILDESASKAVGSTTNAVSSVMAITNLFYNPSENATRAKACASFLRNAVDSMEQRWDRSTLWAIQDTEEEWQVYLAVRGALDAGRDAACQTPKRWWQKSMPDMGAGDAEDASGS